MRKFLMNTGAIVGAAGLLVGTGVGAPVEAATIPIAQVATYTELAPDEIDPADAINQELTSFEAVVVPGSSASRMADPYETRVVIFEIPEACTAGAGGTAARTYACGDQTFSFSPTAYFDNCILKECDDVIQWSKDNRKCVNGSILCRRSNFFSICD